MAFRDLLLLLSLGALWGASFLFIKVGVNELSPLSLVTARMGLASLGLLVPLGLRKLQPRPVQAEVDANSAGDGVVRGQLIGLWREWLVLGLLNAAFPYLLIAWGEERIASGTTAILNATSPLFAVLFVYWRAEGRDWERLGPMQLGGVAVGFVGVSVLVADGGSTSGTGVGATEELFGVGAVLLASASYAVGTLYARRVFAGIPSLWLALGQNVAGALLVMPLALLLAFPQRWPSPEATGAVLALALGGTSLAYVWYFQLLKRVGATRALLVTYLLPGFALIYGALLLGEVVTWSSLVGLGLILGGITATSGGAGWVARLIGTERD